MMKNEKLLKEISHILGNNGFKTEFANDGLLTVTLDERPLCRITDTGSVRYRDSDVGDATRSDALDQVIASAKTVSEYMNILESSPPLCASGLDESYKLLADFGGSVLAGQKMEKGTGVQFVTWLWDHDHSGVTLGHYFGDDYQGAKKDFALRSGLVQEQRQLTPEQLTVLYLCTDDALNYGLNMSYEQENLIRSARSFIEATVPDLEQRIEAMQGQAQQTQTM